MTQQSVNKDWPPVRKRKSVPKWQRALRKYWPPIRFGVIIVTFIAIVTLTITGIVKLAGSNNKPNHENSNHDAWASEETTEEQTLSEAEILAEADKLIAQTDFIAAGYDYQKAISMLESFAYYDRVPALALKITEYQQLDSQLVSYPHMNEITHIFFHSLIADPARAFDGEYTEDGYNLYMTTIDEFNAILEQMYARGYGWLQNVS